GGACDDGDVCTHDDACASGTCAGSPTPGCTACTTDAQCDDGNGCTADACDLPAGNLIQNGSFEDGADPGSYTGLGAGSGAITSWTVDPDSVDYIGSYWVASDGARSVDLSGGAAGALRQTFAPVVSQEYLVTFDMAGNP